jgi:AcrR family transcriptional regulator
MSRPRKSADGRAVAESTRDALLRITIALLNESGEAEIRIESILAEADCSPSSLYHHFGSLRGLIEEAHIARFAQIQRERTAEFRREIEYIETRQELVRFFDAAIEQFFDPIGVISRGRRANALGSTFNRPDFAKRLGEAYMESCEALGQAIRVPQLRGLILPTLDTYSFAVWVQGIFFSRVLIELTGDDVVGARWNAYTKQAAYFLLFGDADPC